ncbi:cytosine permease [Halobacillus sp. BBL2006]|uniref:purine-cytosine permease family protein n=1 Tax=Halobacillus sp. BBL2006 TaxID=1543706 RepID=UPI000543F9D1|nr:cytosine permease [Halobacillus sp. BBL2006]KHE72925.1 cytosine permease [Halobacillus sp. BBL2006]
MRTSSSHKEMIETFGLEAVPKEKQSTPWYRFAFIQFAIAANAGNFIVPALAVIEGGLSFWSGVLATSIGALLGFLFVSYLSLPGSRLGIPAQYAIRTILGVQGARYLSSPIRSLTSLYWFSVQTIGGTYVIQQLFVRLTGNDLPFFVFSIPLSVLMVILAIIGFDAVKQATTYFLPFLLLGELTILYIYFTTNDGPGSWEKLQQGAFEGSISSMFFYASLAFVQYVSGVSASADMTRYAKSPSHGFWGLFVGNGAGFLLTAVIGCASAFLFQNINPYVSASELTVSPVFITIITLTAVISMISINISNAYTGGYSLLNTFSRLTRVQSAVIFGFLGVLLSGFPDLVNEAESYISLLGGLIIPISAIICSDYLIVKRLRLNERSIAQLTKTTSINPWAIVMVSLGCILYFLLPGEWSPGLITFLLLMLTYPLVIGNRTWG